MYVDFEYYSNEYGGDSNEAVFKKAERWSEGYIRSLTSARGNIFQEERTDVKNAVCAVADDYAAWLELRKSGEGNVKSENNDGYSVSYVTEKLDGETDEELLERKAYRTARRYLLPTGWLYRGMRCRNECQRRSDAL